MSAVAQPGPRRRPLAGRILVTSALTILFGVVPVSMASADPVCRTTGIEFPTIECIDYTTVTQTVVESVPVTYTVLETETVPTTVTVLQEGEPETVVETVHHTLTETTTVPTTVHEPTTVNQNVPTTVEQTVYGTVTQPGPTSYFAQYLTQTQTALSVSTAYDRVDVTWALASAVNPATGRTPAVSVQQPRAAAGGAVPVSVSGFTPGEPVQIWLHSTPVLLGSVTAGSDGTANSTVTIPVGTEAGQHTINVVGVTCGIEASIPITIVAGPSDGPVALADYSIDGRSLSYTGVDTGLTVSLGAALLGGGAGLVLLSRRRARVGGAHAAWQEESGPPASGRHRA